MTAPYHFLTAEEDFVPDSLDDEFRVTGTIVSQQHITQAFLDSVAAKRQFQDSRTFSQLTKGDEIERIHLARIPVAVVAKWAREGFDLHALIDSRDPHAAQMILARLRAENLTAFQTTSKTL